MKVLLINGSPRRNGCTFTALSEVEKTLHREGIETELVQLGAKAVQGCIACGRCKTLGRCVFDDLVNETAPKLEAADGLVVGSPVYYASANGSLIAFLDRLFYSTPFDKTMKAGAAVLSCRRGGAAARCVTTARKQSIFTISGMPVVSSQYWNSVHGNTPEEVGQDLEGLQIMRTLGRNMAFLVKKHRARPGEARPARKGAAHFHEFYPLRPTACAERRFLHAGRSRSARKTAACSPVWSRSAA